MLKIRKGSSDYRKISIFLLITKKADASPICIESLRNTQLYRTLIHEFGHYVHYLEIVERPGSETEDCEMKKAKNNFYFRLPKMEKEKFATSTPIV